MPYSGGHCINLSSRFREKPVSLWLVYALTASVVIWLYLLLLPAPVHLTDEVAEGQVFFAANRSVILRQGDCVQLLWSVDNIEAVYLNGQPQVGAGENLFCLDNDPPMLTVVFRDGQEITYQLSIMPLLSSWLTAIILILVFSLLILHQQYIRQRPILSLATAGAVVLFGGLFLLETLPLSATIATENWLAASGAIETLISIFALTLLLLLIGVSVIKPPVTESTTHGLFGLWLATGLLTVMLISGAILLINPRGMYVNTAYKPHQLLLRESKTTGYLNLSTKPDIVIMGSSRAFTLSPDYITEHTGYSAYNMAIEGGRIEDILIQTRQMPVLPPVLLIELQQGLPRESNDIAFRAPLGWLRYMNPNTALLTIEKRLKGLLDLSHLAEAIYISRYQAIYERQPEEWPLFEANGLAHRPLVTEAELEQALLLDIGNIPPIRCDVIDPASQADMQELLHRSAAQETSLVFYVSPWHPRYYEALLQDEPQYQECQSLFTDYMSELSQQETVFFLDYSQLALAGDLDTTQQGYYDSQHLTPANSQRLLDRMVPTLQTVYALSNQKRQR